MKRSESKEDNALVLIILFMYIAMQVPSPSWAGPVRNLYGSLGTVSQLVAGPDLQTFDAFVQCWKALKCLETC
jgi:hypothetical protein